jgi:hypothetical protein
MISFLMKIKFQVKFKLRIFLSDKKILDFLVSQIKIDKSEFTDFKDMAAKPPKSFPEILKLYLKDALETKAETISRLVSPTVRMKPDDVVYSFQECGR